MLAGKCAGSDCSWGAGERRGDGSGDTLGRANEEMQHPKQQERLVLYFNESDPGNYCQMMMNQMKP